MPIGIILNAVLVVLLAVLLVLHLIWDRPDHWKKKKK